MQIHWTVLCWLKQLISHKLNSLSLLYFVVTSSSVDVIYEMVLCLVTLTDLLTRCAGVSAQSAELIVWFRMKMQMVFVSTGNHIIQHRVCIWSYKLEHADMSTVWRIYMFPDVSFDGHTHCALHGNGKGRCRQVLQRGVRRDMDKTLSR